MRRSTELDLALAPEGAVVACLKAHFPNLLGVWAFGSVIKGTPLPGSDLDLAVLVAGYAPPLLVWDTTATLEALVGCAVDLLDLRLASTVMQHQVVTTGRCLWAQQPDAGEFELFVLSEKLALDAARAGLLADIEKTGTIYGR